MAASSNKVQTLHLIPLTLHAISALSLMNSHSFRPNCELSISCYSHIRQLPSICSYLDLKIASNIVISIVHSKLDDCQQSGLTTEQPKCISDAIPSIKAILSLH